jgi:hypothetical protein
VQPSQPSDAASTEPSSDVASDGNPLDALYELRQESVHPLRLSGNTGTVQVLLWSPTPNNNEPTSRNDGTTETASSCSLPITFTVSIDGELDEQAFAQWQFETYLAFRAVHATETASFRGEHDDNLDVATRERRAVTRLIERRELKRGTIELLVKQIASASLDTAQELQPPPRAYSQFFERAFEWSEVTNSYFDRGSSNALSPIPLNNGNDHFLDFLQADYVQTLLPVRPNEAQKVVFFLASGMLWTSPTEDIPVHEANVSLVYNLKQLHRTTYEPHPVGESWEVIVPTTMVVLQDGSGTLRELSMVRVDTDSGDH